MVNERQPLKRLSSSRAFFDPAAYEKRPSLSRRRDSAARLLSPLM